MGTLRLARESDAPALLDIYAQYIDTPVTFEYDLPSPAEFQARVRDILAFYPYLVWEEAGDILGYAYAHRQAERAAFGWNAELSVYLDRTAVGRGAGRRLYGALLELLRLQGIRTAYGLVTAPNPASEALHAAMGFQRMGVQPRAGYKAGAWRDLMWFIKPLADCGPAPAPPRPLRSLPSETVAAVLAGA